MINKSPSILYEDYQRDSFHFHNSRIYSSHSHMYATLKPINGTSKMPFILLKNLHATFLLVFLFSNGGKGRAF